MRVISNDMKSLIDPQNEFRPSLTKGPKMVRSSSSILLVSIIALIVVLPDLASAVPTPEAFRHYRENDTRIQDQERRALFNETYAQRILGLALITGGLGYEDIEDGIAWLTKAANKGDPDAQYALGKYYTLGEVVQEDHPLAWKWFVYAADQGHEKANLVVNEVALSVLEVLNDVWIFGMTHEEALYELGVKYMYGYDVPQDRKLALKLFRLAAYQKHPKAQHAMGALYEFGGMVQQDYAKAYGWWTLAIASGNKITERYREFLVRKMSQDDIVRANKWLKQCAKLKPL